MADIVEVTAKQAFARRLVEAMLDNGHRSSRNAKSGVDVGPLAKRAKVTREMARRYTEGAAMPDVNRMKRIADWLGVRLAWLRDAEGPKTPGDTVEERPAQYEPLSAEAREVALAWSKLSPETAELVRDMIFMLSLGERKFPWLRRRNLKGVAYEEWERQQVEDFAQVHDDRKSK